MYWIPVDFFPADWNGPISNGLIIIGVTSIASAFLPAFQLDPTRPGRKPTTRRGHRAVLWFKLSILIFGLACIIGGTLMQIYWIGPTNPYSAASE